MADRIQRKRTKGWRMPHGAIYVGRVTRWGNPFLLERLRKSEFWDPQHGYLPGPAWRVSAWHDSSLYRLLNQQHISTFLAETEARAACVLAFELALKRGLLSIKTADVTRELRGKTLACWCPLPAPGAPDLCHARVLLEVANG